MSYPLFYGVTQHFPDTSIKDVTAAVRAEFSRVDLSNRVRPGQSVAVGVASRGVHDLPELVAATLSCLRDLGLKPYITPAMGSHGGATGEGQAAVLADMGVSPETTGAPVKASMDVVSLGRIANGAEVFTAADVMEADHIVVVNRVKPHTAFRSDVESGLCKMLGVGLGRQKGASNIHKYDLARTVVPAAELCLAKLPVLCGVAVTENALGGTHGVRVAAAEDFVAADRELLQEAWAIFPRLPIDDLDVLIVDEMGKNISGAGMDPNVVGAWRRDGGERRPDYRVLAVLDLTAASHGNATGVGMADLISQRLLDKIDPAATYTNSLTSRILRSARIPMPRPTDREVVETALDVIPDARAARMARIVNTGALGRFWVTSPLLPELKSLENISVDAEPAALDFDAQGRLRPLV